MCFLAGGLWSRLITAVGPSIPSYADFVFSFSMVLAEAKASFPRCLVTASLGIRLASDSNAQRRRRVASAVVSELNDRPSTPFLGFDVPGFAESLTRIACNTYAQPCEQSDVRHTSSTFLSNDGWYLISKFYAPH